MVLVTAGTEERVVGLHMVGRDVDEILQGFAVAIKAGITRADLLEAIAIHPTSAEEVLTVPPRGP
jgi:glutathione reductase (NADPH)